MRISLAGTIFLAVNKKRFSKSVLKDLSEMYYREKGLCAECFPMCGRELCHKGEKTGEGFCGLKSVCNYHLPPVSGLLDRISVEKIETGYRRKAFSMRISLAGTIFLAVNKKGSSKSVPEEPSQMYYREKGLSAVVFPHVRP